MKGAVLINGYLDGRSFLEPAEMMVSSAQKMGVEMSIIRNSDLRAPIGDRDALSAAMGDPDFVVFWDKDVNLARNLEICDIVVFNTSECIRLCDDKALTHMMLKDWDVPSIKTVSSPMSFGRPIGDWVEGLAETIGFPMVVKDCFGSFGQQVRLIKNMNDLRKEAESGVPRIFQEYIECNGEDVRIEVVGGNVIAAVKRKAPEGDFRSNASNGGVMIPYEPTDEEKSLAIEASYAVQADFAGIDIINTNDGPVVCEVNSNAHIMNLKNATGIDASVPILEHIIRTLS